MDATLLSSTTLMDYNCSSRQEAKPLRYYFIPMTSPSTGPLTFHHCTFLCPAYEFPNMRKEKKVTSNSAIFGKCLQTITGSALRGAVKPFFEPPTSLDCL